MSLYKTKATPGDTSWFTHDRFGMFIHWGLYAMPARHEWVKTYEKISEEHYDKYFKYFNPDMYDPKEWAKKAKAAGMKYVVMTTKHHEGFCMFDSKYTDYKCTNTPAGRDLVREYVDAFRAEGLRIGFYYSLLDWHHPDYTIDYLHPRRGDDNAEELDKNRNMKNYTEYMKNQITELLTNYGKIDILWFDFSYDTGIEKIEADKNSTPLSKENSFTAREYQPWMRNFGGKGMKDWDSEELIKLVRKLQPDIIVNDRTDIEQDLRTPEQYQMLEWMKDEKTGEYITWEACQTFSGSWGYNRDELTWKSPEMLIGLLINTVSVGGNMIMNIGPTSRGYIDSRAEKALDVFAEWMKYNSRSIYGCTMAEPCFKAPRGTRLTQSEDGKKLYIHLMEYPVAFLEMEDIADKIDYAQFLHDGSEVVYISDFVGYGDGEHKNSVGFKLPAIKPNSVIPVIEVFLK